MPAASPPPAIPNLPGVSEKLVEYLRRLSSWSLLGFNNCVAKREAQGELFMKSTTGNSVWRITIDDAGALHTAQLVPGQVP